SEQGEDVVGGIRDGQGHHGPAVVGEHGGVSCRLCLDQLPEGERTAGDLEVDIRALEDLQEHALRGAALVELAGRVQEARRPAEGGGAARVGGYHLADALQLTQLETVDVRLDRDVAVIRQPG